MKKEFADLMLEATFSATKATGKWKRYAFRPEFRYDGLVFIGAISSLVADVVFEDEYREYEKDGIKETYIDPFGTTVSFAASPEISLKELRWVANEIVDLHVIFETLKKEKKYTGIRVPYTECDERYYSEPAIEVIEAVARNLERLGAIEPRFQSHTEKLSSHFGFLVGKRDESYDERYDDVELMRRQVLVDRDFYEFHASRYAANENWPRYAFVAPSLVEAEAFIAGLGQDCYGTKIEAIEHKFVSCPALQKVDDLFARFNVELNVNCRITLDQLRKIASYLKNGRLLANTLELIEPGCAPVGRSPDLSSYLSAMQERLEAYRKYLFLLGSEMQVNKDLLEDFKKIEKAAEDKLAKESEQDDDDDEVEQ